MVLDNLFSRRQKDREKWGTRLPPGQHVVENWPVLSYGGTPRVEKKDWRLRVHGFVEKDVEFTWDEFQALPQTKVHCDIHCVTAWSRFDNDFEGVLWSDLMQHVKPLPDARAVIAHCYGGYTTNVLLKDLEQPDVMVAHKHNGSDLEAQHGGPARLLVPHLYFWKSAKWLRSIEFIPKDMPGFWEQYGYHLRGDPWKEERYS